MWARSAGRAAASPVCVRTRTGRPPRRRPMGQYASDLLSPQADVISRGGVLFSPFSMGVFHAGFSSLQSCEASLCGRSTTLSRIRPLGEVAESGGNRETEGFACGGVPGAGGADGKSGSNRPKKNVSDA